MVKTGFSSKTYLPKMTTARELLSRLLEEIYGGDRIALSIPSGESSHRKERRSTKYVNYGLNEQRRLAMLSLHNLIELRSILRVEMRLMVRLLEKRLLTRDKHRRHQELLCRFVDGILYVSCSKLNTTYVPSCCTRDTPERSDRRAKERIPRHCGCVISQAPTPTPKF